MSKRIAFINFLETVTSFIKNEATVAREWLFPDRDITVAGTDEIVTLQTAINLKLNRLAPDGTAKTDSYALLPADDNDDWLFFNIATAKNLTIPLNATNPLPIGFQKIVYRTGAGTLSIAKEDVSITLDSTSTGVTDQGAEIPLILRKVGINAWKLYNGAPPLTWTALTTTTGTTTGWASISSADVTYIIEGKKLTIRGSIQGTKNGSSGLVSLTNLPGTVRVSSLNTMICTNNTLVASGRCDAQASSTIINFYATAAAGSFTANVACNVFFNITCELL